MRRVLCVVAVLLCLSSLAEAQTATVCVFADDEGTSCTFTDTPGVLSFHVFLVDAPGATAASFSAPKPACMLGATWVGDELAWPVTLGDSQSQVSVGFGQCLSQPVHLLSVNYQTTGASGVDCEYPILNTEYIDCNQNSFVPAGGSAYINSALPCDCDLLESTPMLQVAPTSLTFAPSQNQQFFSIQNVGPGTLNWTATSSVGWMTFSENSGTGDAIVTVFVDRSGLVAGFYYKTINVTSNGGFATILVTVEVDVRPQEPRLSFTPTSFLFQFDEGGQRTFNVLNTGSGDLSWMVTPSVPWITASPDTGTNNTVVQIAVDRNGLADGTYNEQLNVTSNGGNGTVPVQVVVLTQPLLDVAPTSLSFPFDADQRSFLLRNVGAGVLNWSIAADEPWVTVNATSGATPVGGQQTIIVTVDRSALADGNYTASVNIASDGGNAVVSLDVDVDTAPELLVTPAQLIFSAQETSDQLVVTNTGVGPLTWAISSDQPWLSATPDSGLDGPGSSTVVSVVVDRTGLPDSTYEATLSVTSDGGDFDVPVTMVVGNSPILDVTPISLIFSQVATIRPFDIANLGAGVLTWSVATSQSWITVDPTSGTDGGTVTVTVDAGNAPATSADEKVTVTSNAGSQDVDVFWRPATAGSGGAIGLYADVGATQRCIADATPGLVMIYAVHTLMPGATAAQFSAPVPACWTAALWLSDTPAYGATIGNSQAGVAIGFGVCAGGPNLLLTVNVFAQGLAGQDCCAWSVLPDPSVPSGQVEVVDCATNLLTGEGLTSFVSAAPCDCAEVATEHTTWGRLKALYQSEEQMQRLQGVQR